MGATLSYRLESSPSDHVADLIIKEAAHLARIANHWCEPYWFLRGQDGSLAGQTKVSLPGYTMPDGAYMPVDPGDDMFMMAQEVELLLRGLACWSRAYKLQWQVTFEGAPVGTVDVKGEYSSELRSFVAELHSAAATPTDPEVVKARVAELRRRYASRNGDA